MKRLMILWVILMLTVFGMIIIEGFGLHDIPDGLIISAVVAKTAVLVCVVVKVLRML